MSEWDIDRAKSAALASDWADAVVAMMLRSTPLDPVNRKRWVVIAEKITGVLSPIFVFMGTLGLLHDPPREEFQLPSPDQTGDVAAAFLSDPVELIQAAAAWLPSWLLLGVGLSLYAFQAALISTPFTRSNVKTRLSGLRDNGTTLESVLEPFRVAIVGLGWRLSALWASTAAAFGVLAWLMSTSLSFIPGWATVVVIVWGHYAVSSFIGSDNKRRIGGALTLVKGKLSGSLLNALLASDKPEPSPPRDPANRATVQRPLQRPATPWPPTASDAKPDSLDDAVPWRPADTLGMAAGTTDNPSSSPRHPINTSSDTRSVAPLSPDPRRWWGV